MQIDFECIWDDSEYIQSDFGYIYRVIRSIYRVIQEEKSIFCEVIVSVIVRKESS